MFQTSFPKEEFIPFPKVEKHTLGLYVPVDQYDAKDFNLNDCGWSRNSISQIARAQSMEEYNAIVQRLVEIKQDGGLPDDITDREAFDTIKPRYSQSACEIEQFIELTNDTVMAKVDAAYKKAVGLDDEKKATSSSSSSSDSDAPVASE